MIPAASSAARAAGAVVAAGFVLGVVAGPVTGVIGGLALVTFGRALTLDRVHEVRFALALAVLAGAIGIAVLRWGTLDLDDLRGVQAVLGPTVLVGPERAAAACIAAACGGILALGAWLEEGSPQGTRPNERPDPEGTGRVPGTVDKGLPIPETIIGSAALALAFWGPAPRGLHLGDFAVTVGATVVVGVAAAGVALGLRRMGPRFVWATIGLAGATVAAAAALIA